MNKGWFQIGFLKNFENPMTPIDTSAGPLMVVNTEGSLSVYSAVCPHRGANLAIGGILNEGSVRCPFHGCTIGLDCMSKEGFRLNALNALQVESLLFVNLTPDMDMGFTKYIMEINKNHIIIPGFQMEVKIKPEMVIENAFDQMHFRTVHSILNEPIFKLIKSEKGEFSVKGVFDLLASPWQKISSGKASVPYIAKAFSPYTVISMLEGKNPYYIITSAKGMKNGNSLISLSIAIPIEQFNPSNSKLYQYLIQQSRKGIELDKIIWENITASTQRFQSKEKSVIGFQLFCKQFFKKEIVSENVQTKN